MGLDMVEIILACEDSFQLEIPDRDAVRLGTVGDLFHYIIERLEADPTRHSQIWNELRNLVAQRLDIEASIIRKESRFVQDLGAD